MTIPDVTTWHVYPDGLHIWRGGQLVAVIPQERFGELVYRLAEAMRGNA